MSEKNLKQGVTSGENDNRKGTDLERQRVESHCGILWDEACYEGRQTQRRVKIEVGERLTRCDGGGLSM